MATKTSTAPKDDRLFIRITLDFFDSEKVFPLSPGAKLAFIEMIAWSARQHTDGRIRKRLALAKWTPGIIEELLDSDPERPLLAESDTDYFIHDYAEHQQTTADIEAVREARRAAGRKGGLAKAAAQKGVSSKKVAKASKPLAKPAEKENEKENYKKKGERKARGSVAAPVALCPVPDAPSSSSQIENGLTPAGVAPATAVGHPAALELQESKPGCRWWLIPSLYPPRFLRIRGLGCPTCPITRPPRRPARIVLMGGCLPVSTPPVRKPRQQKTMPWWLRPGRTR